MVIDKAFCDISIAQCLLVFLVLEHDEITEFRSHLSIDGTGGSCEAGLRSKEDDEDEPTPLRTTKIE